MESEHLTEAPRHSATSKGHGSVGGNPGGFRSKLVRSCSLFDNRDFLPRQFQVS